MVLEYENESKSRGFICDETNVPGDLGMLPCPDA